MRHLSCTYLQRLHQGSATLHSGITHAKTISTAHTSRVVLPGNVTPLREVPNHVPKPPYLDKLWGIKSWFKSREPERKTPKQIQGMRDVCYLAQHILTEAGKYATEGTTTEEIDGIVHDLCMKNNAYPSPLLYRTFPKSVCTSVNNVVCHGIPDDRALRDGDIINIDITVSQHG